MQHVNPSFNIQSAGIYTDSAQLFIEAGPMGISFAILNTGDCFQAVVTYSFSNKMNEPKQCEKIKEILLHDELLQKPFAKTHIIWSYPESILVPPNLVDAENNNDMLNLVYGDAPKGVIKSDFLYKHNLHNVYRVPETVRESVEAKFPYATQTHQYSLLVNRETNGGDELFVVFYTSSLTLMLLKEGHLQVIQNFAFSSPEDTAYHLLNVCKSFDVQPNKVILHISGMIDEKSNLYAAIYKYFLHIEFDKLPGNYTYAEEIKDHPPHFFSHLFALAACV
ncbi:MAG: DUF3822 family protein [Ferruginibacter sp.]